MGMFDRVYAVCPRCGGTVEFQSKAGECQLDSFTPESVPLGIAGDLHHTMETCVCGASVMLVCPTTRVCMRAEAFDDPGQGAAYLAATRKLQE